MKRELAKRGFTLIELMIVMLVITIVVSIAVPNFMISRTTSSRTACIANLAAIEHAKDQVGMAKNLQDGSTLQWTDLVPTYIKTTPACPTGGTYTLNPIGTDATCSLAVSLGHHG